MLIMAGSGDLLNPEYGAREAVGYITDVRYVALILPGRQHNGVALTFMHYRGNVLSMPLAHSKLTAQGQISVPSEIRKKLGVGPGSILEWDEKNDEVIVRRAGRHTSMDVHEALFAAASRKPKASASVNEGIRKHIRQKHARR